MNVRFVMLGVAVVVALVVGCGGDGGPDSVTGSSSEETGSRSKGTGSSSEDTSSPSKDTGSPSKRKGPRTAWITLDGNQSPTNVGILMARKLGYFKDAGIAVTITTPVVPENALGYVEEGSVEFGVSHQPEVVLAREKGAPVIAVGSVIPRPTAAMIWLRKSKIHGLVDLEGKTIAIPSPFPRAFLEVVLARVGLTLDDVKVKRVVYDLLPTLVSGRADAIFGGSWNIEGAALEARGLKPVVTRVETLGVPAYDELVLVTRPALAERDPDLVQDVLSAAAKGAAAAVAHPESAATLLDRSVEADPSLGREAMEAELEATIPLLSKSGYMDTGQADHLVDWMYDHDLIQQRMPASELLTNSYLGS